MIVFSLTVSIIVSRVIPTNVSTKMWFVVVVIKRCRGGFWTNT